MATLEERLQMMNEALDKQVESARPEIQSQEERFRNFQDAGNGEDLRAFGQGALGQGLEGTGMAAGYQLGKRFGLPGMALGAGAGYLVGDLARNIGTYIHGPVSDQPLTYKNLTDVPEGQRPYAAAGEAVGGGGPFAIAPFAAAGMGPAKTLLGKTIQQIGKTAQDYPTTFAIGEAGGLAGAGMGAAAAEASVPQGTPGSTVTRMAGETVGGALTPVRLPMMGLRFTGGLARRAVGLFSPEIQEREAAKVIQGIVQTAGEDPAAIVNALDAAGTSGMTTAQASMSPVLKRMENTLVSGNPALGKDLQYQTKEVLDDIAFKIKGLTEVGSPAALQAAALLRKRHVETLMESQKNAVEQKALDAVQRLPVSASPATSSKVMWNTISDAMLKSRDQEKLLWKNVDNSLPGSTKNQLDAYNEVQGQLVPVPADKMPPIVEQWIAKLSPKEREVDVQSLPSVKSPAAKTKTVTDPGYQPTTGELITMRSRMLTLSREAADDHRWSDANAYGKMADGIFADIEDSFTKAGKDSLDSYNTARAFSHSFHDTFTRTFAGTSLDTGPMGRFRVPPEVLGRRMMGAGQEGAGLRFREAQEAARFLPSQGMGEEQLSTQMMQAQSDFIRAAASSLIGRDGHVSADSLARFQKQYADVLAAHPETAALFTNAQRAEATLETYMKALPTTRRRLESEAAFYRINGGENTTEVIGRIINGPKRVNQLTQLANIARDDSPEAVQGMRSAIMSWAWDKAGGETKFDAQKWANLLTAPMGPHDPSPVNFMVAKGLLTREEGNTLRTMAQRLSDMTLSGSDPRTLKGMVMHADFMTDFALRIVGARIGSVLSEGAGAGAPIVIAGAGSRAIRQLFDKIPVGKTKELLELAATNPQFAKILLQKDVPPLLKPKLGTQAQAYLIDAGLIQPANEVQAQIENTIRPMAPQPP